MIQRPPVDSELAGPPPAVALGPFDDRAHTDQLALTFAAVPMRGATRRARGRNTTCCLVEENVRRWCGRDSKAVPGTYSRRGSRCAQSDIKTDRVNRRIGCCPTPNRAPTTRKSERICVT